MGRWVVEQQVLEMARRGMEIGGAPVLVLVLAFKENCPDLRHTRLVNLIEALCRYGMEPDVVDPWVDPAEAQREYGLEVRRELPAEANYPAVIAAVVHHQLGALVPAQWRQLLAEDGLLGDLKGIVPRELQPLRL